MDEVGKEARCERDSGGEQLLWPRPAFPPPDHFPSSIRHVSGPDTTPPTLFHIPRSNPYTHDFCPFCTRFSVHSPPGSFLRSWAFPVLLRSRAVPQLFPLPGPFGFLFPARHQNSSCSLVWARSQASPGVPPGSSSYLSCSQRSLRSSGRLHIRGQLWSQPYRTRLTSHMRTTTSKNRFPEDS